MSVDQGFIGEKKPYLKYICDQQGVVMAGTL